MLYGVLSHRRLCALFLQCFEVEVLNEVMLIIEVMTIVNESCIMTMHDTASLHYSTLCIRFKGTYFHN